MPFNPGMLKTGGRKPGTPNRRTQDIEEKLAALGCDPISGMARIAMDEAQPIETRASMFKELAQYVAPKRKALEICGSEGGPTTLEQLVMASFSANSG